LVSVDVNGGHIMLGQGTSQEKAILEVNLEAAKQVRLQSFWLACQHHLNLSGNWFRLPFGFLI
jgi:hypothetical protein